MGLTNIRGKQMHEIVSDKTKCRAEDKTGSWGPESLVRGQVWLKVLDNFYGKAGTSGWWVERMLDNRSE